MIYVAVVLFCGWIGERCAEVTLSRHYPTEQACEDDIGWAAMDWLYARDPGWRLHYASSRCEIPGSAAPE